MFGSQFGNSFQLNKNSVLNKHICQELADNHTIVHYFDWILLNYLQTIFPHPMSMRIFINFFYKTNSKGITDLKCAGNDLFCELIYRDFFHSTSFIKPKTFIPVYLR